MPFNKDNFEGLNRINHLEDYLTYYAGKDYKVVPAGNMICVGGDPFMFVSSGAYTANDCHASRVTVPATGTLVDLSVGVVSQSGAFDVGIYSLDAEPRQRLYSTGSIAMSASGWNVVGQPNLSVTQGQVLDFVLACENGTATFGHRALSNLNLGNLPSNSFWAAGNGSVKCVWFKASSFPLPTSFANSAITTNTIQPAIMARII